MPSDSEKIGFAPAQLPCSPVARSFPAGWKDFCFRRRSVPDDQGLCVYRCPICRKCFDHTMISYLHGDHVWPYSLFGETTWENYQLICGDCNLSKSNRLENNIRRMLGTGAFRGQVIAFLNDQVTSGILESDAVLESIVGIHKKPE